MSRSPKKHESTRALRREAANELPSELDRGPSSIWFDVRVQVLVLVLAGFVAYINSFAGTWVFDDVHAILGNPRIRQLRPIGPILGCERPLVELSLAINFALGGLRTEGYHAVNLLIHLIAGLALFGFLRRGWWAGTAKNKTNPHPASPMEGRGESKQPQDTSHSAFRIPHSPFPFAVALLWVVHPLQTESVTYIVQRGESMMGMFCLLSLYAFARATEFCAPMRWGVLSILFCAAAMACKAVAVVLPIVLFLFDWRVAGGTLRAVFSKRVSIHVGLFLTWGVLAATGVVAQILTPQTDRIAIGLGFKGVTPWEYLLTQSGVLIRYLRLSLAPYPLCLDYAWPAARSLGEVVVPAITIVALLAATAWAMIRRPRWGFAGVWFFLFLAPTSSVIPVRDMAVEHRMYLPLAGVVVILVAAADAVIRRWFVSPRTQSLASALALTFATVVFVGTTLARNQDYKDDLEMWRDVASKQPQNARAHVNIGVLLERKGDLNGAVEAYQKALAIDKEYSDAHYNLSVALLRLNKNEDAEKHLREAIRITPEDPGANLALGDLLFGRSEFEPALAAYTVAKKTRPKDPMAYSKICTLLRRMERAEEALTECQEAVRLGPEQAYTHEALALVYIVRGDMASAVPLLQKTLELDPKNFSATCNLGTVLKSEGRVEESLEVYRKGIALKPNESIVHLQLADSLMSLGRADQALVEFETAVRLAPQDLDARLSYARALKRVGRKQEAATHYQHALTIRPDHPEAVRALQEITGGP